MAIIIRGIGKALPLKEMKNTDFPLELNTSDEWIQSHTGILSRRIADEHETSADLAHHACAAALSRSSTDIPVTADMINLIICATVTPHYKNLPSNACVVQGLLNAAGAAAFDVAAGCAGFVYALDTAAALMVRRSWRFALVCGCEVLSRVLDWTDRSTCVLFGDGAGAVLLENTFTGEKTGIGSVILRSDGSGYDKLYIDGNNHIRMNGRAVYDFAVSSITETVKALLAEESLRMEDIDLVVCHQANKRILEAAAKRLKSTLDTFVCNMAHYGNTSAASIPITLADLAEQGRLREGMVILLIGFGAGLAWGGCVIRL